ncbi:MAG: pirin family protein [Gammaproteobacteria bacterium]|nr:pirin family protein [Gammaproteobacteria bacterium]
MINSTTFVRHANSMKEGDGADVQRLFPLWQKFMNFDPFVLWDHFSISGKAGFPSHPHRGFEAITYMFEGSMRHEDNLGNASTVLPGGAQRFTAGQGIIHSEMPGPEGYSGGIQLWINLPKKLKNISPGYQQVNAEEFPEYAIDKGKVKVVVGKGSPLKLLTPVRYLHITLEKDGVFNETPAEDARGLIYMIEGETRINGQALKAGDAFFSTDKNEIKIEATQQSQLMLCFGTPHNEPIRQYGPYVD